MIETNTDKQKRLPPNPVFKFSNPIRVGYPENKQTRGLHSLRRSPSLKDGACNSMCCAVVIGTEGGHGVGGVQEDSPATACTLEIQGCFPWAQDLTCRTGFPFCAHVYPGLSPDQLHLPPTQKEIKSRTLK